MYISHSSIKDKVGPCAHGPGGARGPRVQHDAPHVRARAVAAAARRAAGLALQRALRARSHEVRRRRADRIRRAKPESINLSRADCYIACIYKLYFVYTKTSEIKHLISEFHNSFSYLM